MHPLLSQDLDHILSYTEALWGRIKNKRIFITGGTGFFGCWLLSSFIWANQQMDLNAEAVVLSRDPDKFRKKAPEIALDPSITLIKGDIRAFQFPEGDFSYIIHGATESSSNLNAVNPYEMVDTITSGTQHVLQFACKHPLEGFLYISSGAVYGRQPPDISHLPETYLGGPNYLSPSAAYAEGKRTAELLSVIKNPSINVSIARCFAFVGPYLPLDTHYAIIDFINDAMHGERIIIQGDGSPYRSYLYAADLAIWLWTILFKGQRGEAYNVGSPDALQIVEVAKTVAGAFSPQLDVLIRKAIEPGKPSERYIPDVQKAERDLNLKAIISLETAIRKTIEWNQSRLCE